MTFQDIIDNAKKAAELTKEGLRLAAVTRDNLAKMKATLSADQMAEIDAILEPLHEANMQLADKIDAAAARAEKL